MRDLRFAVDAARRSHERALRDLRTAEARADWWREPDGSFPVLDPGLNPDSAAEIARLQPDLDRAAAALDAATATLDAALLAYTAAAAGEPLFPDGNADPVLLLPVRLEAVYRDAELLIRVYPDDVHVDSHEPALTATERRAGIRYWQAVRVGDPDAAWQALVGSCGGARAAWVRACLEPAGEAFPDVETRPEAWTRAAHTRLLPDRFVFSGYRDGELRWRVEGAPVPDPLPVGLAPVGSDLDAADPDGAEGFDAGSRWLVDFDLAVGSGMAAVVGLGSADERFDLVTAVGVGTQDARTGADRVAELLTAHRYSGGLAPLAAGTPTNNTPASRSGWRSRDLPVPPDVAQAWRAAYDAASDQDAARLARALGIDGEPVLAGVCDPAGGDEPLLRRLNRLHAAYHAWSPMLRPAADSADPDVWPVTEPWFAGVAEHFVRHVRSRGPLPALRIGRQPYGLLPVSATNLWTGSDVDPDISRFVRSFLAAFAEHVDRAPRVGEGADQDAVLLDLLSREASPREVVRRWDFGGDVKINGRPPASAVGAIPASSSFAWTNVPDGPGPDAPGGDPSLRVERFPEFVPDAVRDMLAQRPLTQLLVVFDVFLEQMRATGAAVDPNAFHAMYPAVAQQLDLLREPPNRSIFFDNLDWVRNALSNHFNAGPGLPAAIAERTRRATAWRALFAEFVRFEDDVIADLPRFERLFRETLEPLAHRIDAWVSSLSTARLARCRETRPEGVRTGAYGWLTEVEPVTPNPAREGYVVTPSLHHATTAAILRSGWQAHADRRAFAVDIQSARVRRALAMLDGVRAGQSVGALLGYQFERALHDARLDRHIRGFRTAFPLAPLVEPDTDDARAAKVAIGARNVVDGQALRRARGRLADPDELAAAAGHPVGDDAPALARILADLDETFDAAGDLLLAEGVHQLVGGSPLRAGLAVDAIGRAQELPADFDVLRTPRGGVGVTHHVGILFPGPLPGDGWADDRPLALLEPGLEAWLRRRFGPAPDAALGWCALDLLIAPAERARAALPGLAEEAFAALMVVCERLRAALSTATPLTPAHLDPTDTATDIDRADLEKRLGRWLADVRAAAGDLGAVARENAGPVLARLGRLGLPVGLAGVGDLDRVRSLLDVDWDDAADSIAARLLHPAVTVCPVLARALPPAPEPAVAADEVADWLRDMALVRPRVDTLDGACVAAEVVAGTPAAGLVVTQPVAAPWTAVAHSAATTSAVLRRDDAPGSVSGLVVDSWTEVVPRAPEEGVGHGPEEVIGVAFDYDRPGARAPQALLLAVPPDPDRGWCAEDLHACVDEALLLARLRTLDLGDLPELRSVLPIPDGR